MLDIGLWILFGFQAILQKAEVLDQSGNYEMALVYYNRGAKHFPRSQEFKDGIKKAEKNSSRTGTPSPDKWILLNSVKL